MRKFCYLLATLLLLGLLGFTARASADPLSDPREAPQIEESLAASLGKDVVEAAHPSAKKISILEYKVSDSNGHMVASLKMIYHGQFTDANYTANISITIDPAKPPRVVDVVYKDDNRIPANKKRLEGVHRDLEKRLKNAWDAKQIAKAQQIDSDIDSDIAAIERLVKVGKGSRPYVESAASRRLVDWKRAAEKGLPTGQFLYGRALELGAGVTKDEQKAVEWFRRAAEAGLPMAQNILGLFSEEGTVVSKDPQEAVRWYRMAADAGLGVAQLNLGKCYRVGSGTKIDRREAVKWFRRAADQGYAVASFNLAEMYHFGEGVETDTRQAAQLYRKAAEAGHAYSYLELGLCYVNGTGVSEDKPAAEKCFRRGADAGDFDCQCELANWNVDGRASKPDVDEALKLLEKARAQATNAIAKRKVEHALTLAYKKSGIEHLERKEKEKAGALLRHALELAEKLDKEYPGRFYTEDALGGCFLALARYHEEASELDKAVTYYQKASDMGTLTATRRLAEMYKQGQGVKADPEKARALQAIVDRWKMVRLMIPGEREGTGRKVPIPLFISDDFTGDEWLAPQERWYKDEGIIIPAAVKESYMKVYKIAQENNVSFTELLKYTLEVALKPSAPPAKDQ